ncbi:MAG: monofunctional biosynthetic peptidoglycan transglycosylase [Gammaproteobacteria bacterium]|nr:monofunctional biosynthetic peptidoglycan transglycosylase [Gammaproteobacteria bacterium]
MARGGGWLRRALRRVLLGVMGALAAVVLLVWLLRWVDPPSSAFMLEARWHALMRGEPDYRQRYRWVALEDISPQMAMAVIAAEDQQFPFHAGFDFKSIREAVRHNAHSRRVRGASTISQQVAKNLFLWSGRSYLRKGLEAGLTVLIEWLWPKERILETYLNIAQFGRGTYGVEAAAQRYFGKSARRLRRTDAALLAAVLPNPLRLRVEAPSTYVRARQAWILGQMAGLGGTTYLDELEAPTVEPRAQARGQR